MTDLRPGTYCLAPAPEGSLARTLRVKVVEVIKRADVGSIAIVRTACLADAGTLLYLHPSELEPIAEEYAVRHKDGLVAFG